MTNSSRVPRVLRVLPVLCVLFVPSSYAQWKQAEAGYTFAFPRDHASHPEYKIEWWYYTGNLDTKDGRRFGYHVTFFRVGVDWAPANPSKWAVRDVFMTHLAVSDVKGQRYRFNEKLTRGGPGLAGAAGDQYRVWNEDWLGTLDASGRHVLTLAAKNASVDFVLDEGKRAVSHGIGGLSQKGARAGNASHYYSLTRMPTRGTITIDGESFEVAGDSWMDHEFGTTFLEPEQKGWDWLSIQLTDGRELMLYRFRREDGSDDPRSSGTVIAKDGQATHLTNTDFTLTPNAPFFTSKNGAKYPLNWTLKIPSQKLDLTIATPLQNQELTLERSTGVAYWEGLIDVSGSSTGRGYLEMTGYYGSLGGVLSGQ
jgi:predicted secreted hydrolase